MTEFEDVMKTALQALEAGQTVALATVVQVRGSAPRHTGARLLLWPDGRLLGTVGGGTLEEKVVSDAQQALQASHSRLEKYSLSTDPEQTDSLGLCGGEVLVSIEVLEPPPSLVIVGAGHIANAMAQMAAPLGWELVLVDDRLEFLDPGRFPANSRLLHVPYERTSERLDPIPLQLTPASLVLVATWGWDEPALAQILGQEVMPAYVGLISSKTKWRVIREMLAKRGLPAERLDQVHAPAGLSLGAESPAEVGLAVLAEMLARRRQAGGQSMKA